MPYYLEKIKAVGTIARTFIVPLCYGQCDEVVSTVIFPVGPPAGSLA